MTLLAIMEAMVEPMGGDNQDASLSPIVSGLYMLPLACTSLIIGAVTMALELRALEAQAVG